MPKHCKNSQRQLAVLNVMFQSLDISNEADFTDAARKNLQKHGLLIHQCPHWCETIEILNKCMLGGETAGECIVVGVTSGDFPFDE